MEQDGELIPRQRLLVYNTTETRIFFSIPDNRIVIVIVQIPRKNAFYILDYEIIKINLDNVKRL